MAGAFRLILTCFRKFLSEKFNETAEIKSLVRKISNETAVLSATKSLMTDSLEKNQRDYEDFFTYKKGHSLP